MNGGALAVRIEPSESLDHAARLEGSRRVGGGALLVGSLPIVASNRCRPSAATTSGNATKQMLASRAPRASMANAIRVVSHIRLVASRSRGPWCHPLLMGGALTTALQRASSSVVRSEAEVHRLEVAWARRAVHVQLVGRLGPLLRGQSIFFAWSLSRGPTVEPTLPRSSGSPRSRVGQHAPRDRSSPEIRTRSRSP